MASHAQCKLNGTTENTFEGILENSKHCVNRKETGVDVSEFTEIECIEAGYDWEKIKSLWKSCILKLFQVIQTMN